MAYNLGSAHGGITITYDANGVARARNHLGQFVSLSDDADDRTNSLNRSLLRLGISWGALGRAMLASTKYIIIGSVAIQSMANSVGLLIALAQTLAPVLGAALATLPGIALSGAAALLVFKAAMTGVGDALKAAVSGDLSKLNEAIKNLAPNAANAVRAVAAVTKQLKPMQQAIQNAFFAGFDRQITAIGNAIYGLKGRSEAVATAMNAVGLAFLGFLKSPTFIGAAVAALKTVETVLLAIAPAIGPMLEGFAKLAAQIGQFASGAGQALGQVFASIGEFLGSVNLAAVFDSAAAALRPFMELARNLGTILGNVFGALTQGGDSAVGILGQIVAHIAAFTESTEGAAALNALGAAIGAIAGGVGQALLALLKGIAPAISALSPLVTVLARILSAELVHIFEILGPVVTQVAESLNANLGSILPTIGEAIRSVVTALGPLVALLGGQLAAILPILAPILSQAVAAFGQLAVALISGLIPAFEELAPVLMEMVSELLPALLPAILSSIKLMTAFVPIIVLVANVLVSLLIPAIRVLTPILAFLAKVIASIIDWLVAIIGPIGTFISKWLTLKQIGDFISALFGGIKTVIMSVINAVTGAVSGGVNAIKGAISSLGNIGGMVSGFFGAMRSAISSQIGAALAVVRSFPGQVAGALGNLGGLLQGAGRDLMQGLINGIRQMASAAMAAARAAVAGIPGVIKGVLGISSPSKITTKLGQQTGEGLVVGLLSMLSDIRQAAGKAANAALLGITPDIGVNVSAALAASNGLSYGYLPPPAVSAAPATSSTVINTTVNAPQNMNPEEVATLAASRVTLAINTGTGG